MPWGRVDDSHYDHPKLDRLPAASEAVATVSAEGLVRLAAVGLFWRAISWCNRFLTDGHVPRDRVAKLDGSVELAELLVGSGLWEEAGHGYQVHDFLDFNVSRAEILKRREKEAARKAEYRAKQRVADAVDGDVDKSPRRPRRAVPAGQRAAGDGMSHAESRRPSRRVSPRDSRERAPGDAIAESRPVPVSTTTPPTPSPARGRRNGRAGRSTTDYDRFVVTDESAPGLTPAGEAPTWLDEPAAEVDA